MRLIGRGLLLIGMAGAAMAGQAQALTLQELKADLAKHPEVNWQAGDTGVVEQFAGKAVKFGLSPKYKMKKRAPRSAFKTPADAAGGPRLAQQGRQELADPDQQPGQVR